MTVKLHLPRFKNENKNVQKLVKIFESGWDDTKDLIRPWVCNWDRCKCNFPLKNHQINKIKATKQINFMCCTLMQNIFISKNSIFKK